MPVWCAVTAASAQQAELTAGIRVRHCERMACRCGPRCAAVVVATAVLKAPLEPNQQPNYTPSGTPNETGPEAARKQAEAARGSGRNPQAEAARKPLANPLHACFRPACMRQSLLPSSSYEASGRADQVHRCHRLGSVFSCSSTRQACMRNITIASVDASHDGDFCLRLSPSASA